MEKKGFAVDRILLLKQMLSVKPLTEYFLISLLPEIWVICRFSQSVSLKCIGSANKKQFAGGAWCSFPAVTLSI